VLFNVLVELMLADCVTHSKVLGIL